jgi:hypothetical protein
MTSFGDLPVVLKRTTTRNTDGYYSTVTETVYATNALPSLNVGDSIDSEVITTLENETYGLGMTKQTITTETRSLLDGEGVEIVPDTEFSEQTSYVELDIRQHPSFATLKASGWDDEKGEFLPTSQYYGVSGYIVGSTQVTKTSFHRSQPSSDYGLVGSLGAPGGGFGGTNNWLIIGSSRRKVGENLYAKELVYLYSARGWDTTIY